MVVLGGVLISVWNVDILISFWLNCMCMIWKWWLIRCVWWNRCCILVGVVLVVMLKFFGVMLSSRLCMVLLMMNV